MATKLKFGAHISEETLEEYAFRRLSEQETCLVEEHLLVCESCQQLLADVDQHILTMKSALLERVAAPGRKLAWYIAGASIAAAVALTVWWPRAAREPAETVTLVAFRGVEMARMHAGRPADFRIEMPDLTDAVYRIEVVDAAGAAVWRGEAPATGHQLRVSEPKPLKSGVYWIRLLSPAGKLLREFGLEAGTG